jgi:nicotinamidase-related amidase
MEMSSKALIVIDIQNDITKHYREIIDNLNAAIDWGARSKFSVMRERTVI